MKIYIKKIKKARITTQRNSKCSQKQALMFLKTSNLLNQKIFEKNQKYGARHEQYVSGIRKKAFNENTKVIELSWISTLKQSFETHEEKTCFINKKLDDAERRRLVLEYSKKLKAIELTTNCNPRDRLYCICCDIEVCLIYNKSFILVG